LSLLEGFVRQQLSQVLRLAPERLTTGTPLKSLGLDSLMTLELRNRLEAGSGIALSATLAWNYPTIEALAEHLAARLELPLAMPEPGDSDNGSATFEEELEELSQDEVAIQLREELDAIERLLRAD
jgi:acyl carrier protein